MHRMRNLLVAIQIMKTFDKEIIYTMFKKKIKRTHFFFLVIIEEDSYLSKHVLSTLSFHLKQIYIYGFSKKKIYIYMSIFYF